MTAYVCSVVLLTLALVAQLLQQGSAAAPCQAGTLLDARAPAPSQPRAPTASLAVKIKVLDTATIQAINIFMNPGGGAPSLVTINSDSSGSPGAVAATYDDVTVIDAAQYQFRTVGTQGLGAGLYWFVFKSSDGSEIDGWSWSQWSGVNDDVHSLSFAGAAYADDLVPRLLIDGCGITFADASPARVLIAFAFALANLDRVTISDADADAPSFPDSIDVKLAVSLSVRVFIAFAFAHLDRITISDADADALSFPDFIDVTLAVSLRVRVLLVFALADLDRITISNTDADELAYALCHAISFPDSIGFALDVAFIVGISFIAPISLSLMGLINATAEFEPVQAAFRLSGTFSRGASAGSGSGSNSSSESSLTSKLISVQLGNVTLLASDLAGTTTREEIPDQGEGKLLTYVYTTSLLNNATSRMQQSFAFHKRSSRASFAGVEFEIEANSVKWSLNFTSSSATTDASSSSPLSSSSSHTTTVRYQLAGADGQLTSPARANIVRRANTPSEGITTYHLPLHHDSSSQSVFATVTLFDLAVVDGVVTPVRHNITLVPVPVPAANASADADDDMQAQFRYEVAVELPAFDQWMHYDPSVGMGLLLGDGRGSGGSDDNTGLIVGVAVTVPVAVAVVLAAIFAGVAFGWYKRRALRSSHVSINFNEHDDGADQFAGL